MTRIRSASASPAMVSAMTDQAVATTQASVGMRALITEALAGARVPTETREKIAALLESTIDQKQAVVREFLATRENFSRAMDMMEAYANGETLAEIGATHDMTRERVRQILTSTFGDYRAMQDPDIKQERAAQGRVQETLEWDATHGTDIERMFAEGMKDKQISERLGVSERRVAAYRTRHGLCRTRGQDWSDDQVLGALRAAEAAVGDLSISTYTTWRNKNPTEYPSWLTFMLRYDSFDAACAAAGVKNSGRVNSVRRNDYITPEKALVAMRTFVKWGELNGERLTTGTYAKFREDYEAPSLAIIIRRLGGFRPAVAAAKASG